MGIPVLHLGATVGCQHGGTGVPTTAAVRVTVQGQPVLTIGTQWLINGCLLPPQAGSGPCIGGQFLTGATRVLVEGAAVALQNSLSVCHPTALPMMVTPAQFRVTAV